MTMNKRDFLKLSSASAATIAIGSSGLVSAANVDLTKSSGTLTNIVGDLAPISSQERIERILKAQQLMQQMNVSAIVLEPGAAMDYFTGIQWWSSERLTAVVIPKQGDISVVCPFFEEPSIRESLSLGTSTIDVRVWQEHESPFTLIKQILTDRKVNQGTIGFEDSVRYFVLQGVMSVLPKMQHVSAESVTRGCRMIKSKHELQIMLKANEITLTAYQVVWQQLALGMSQSDVKALMQTAQTQLGGSGVWNMALFNEASAYPHGTKQQQTIKEGSIVLMDCGCSVFGYQSDISRTFVFGEASKKQRKIWDTVRKGQEIAFENAKLGVQAGKVDDAVRAFYESEGLGPDYKLPGLSHRSGHGIGMEGHESVNFVHGETETLKAGMCFSNEPGIYLPGEFGVRLEDCLYFTEQGPQWFTIPPSSIEEPIGKLGKV